MSSGVNNLASPLKTKRCRTVVLQFDCCCYRVFDIIIFCLFFSSDCS